jgi:tripartite ATP-independent transporter DctM subunit
MDPLISSLILMIILLALLASGIWVAISLLLVGMIGLILFASVPLELIGGRLATTSWGSTASWSLTALPLFIWMGEILFRTRLSQDLFRGLSPWLAYLPGRLVHTNVVGSAVFAAVCGSSAATAATIGKISLPELRQRGYDEGISVGSLAGAATLGILIPPSIMFIVYGVSAEISIARLFMAGIFPAILLVVLFMGYIIIWSLLHPGQIPEEPSARAPFMEKLRISGNLIPTIGLIILVLGSLYFGIATPTESAVLGVVGALLLSTFSGSLTQKAFVDSLMGATRTSCMIGFILVGAAFLTVVMGFTRIPELLAVWINSLQLSYYSLLFVLTLFFILLGCFLDGISVIVLTTSVILPMIEHAGIDKIWFGVYVVITVEMSQITPPVGFNLFVIQGLSGHDIFYVAKTALPFFLLLLVATLVLIAFPQIVTWLPQQMIGR